MHQHLVLAVGDTNMAIVHSFADGDRLVRVPFRPETEEIALARAVFLENEGKFEAASKHLDLFLRRR